MRYFITTAVAACTVTLAACSTQNAATTVRRTETPATTATPAERADPAGIDQFVRAAGHYGNEIVVPRFESTPEELEHSAERSIADAEIALDRLALQDPAFASFNTTIKALDDITYPVITTLNRMFLIQESDPDAAMRDAARAQSLNMQNWFVGLQYREDIYRVCKAFGDAYKDGRRRPLQGESLRLYEHTMRDYPHTGMDLDADTRGRVEELQKTLAELSTEFNANITNANVELIYSRDELDGFSDEMLERYANEDGTFTFKATVTPEFVAVMVNANSEESRERMKTARYSVMQSENIPVLNDIVRVRDEIASLLGYATWADYQTEVKMAGDGATALAFLEDLAAGLEPKFVDEIAIMQRMKAEDSGDNSAEVAIWDWRHYQNEMLKRDYDIDVEFMRNFFPYQACLDGMFDIYEEIFDLEFTQVVNPDPWAEGVELHVVSDATTGEPLGMFYLDMFPREGKYNHFAQFDVVGGKRLENGVYRRPIAALLCNFTPASGDTPALMSHEELETLFHEFGHAMHTILTRAETSRFAGTNVPRDFVEAPSQMLEAWVWDTDILNTFAGDWRDPSQKIDAAVLARMKDARLATQGVLYSRQLALGIGDMRLHGEGASKDAQDIINGGFADVFLATPDDTAMAAYWGHMTGYDAGYYGYAWADAIANDMQSIFKESPDGLMSKEIGMRLRNEVYAPGGSRPIDESIEAFLGRERSIKPFLENIGIPQE